MSNKYFGTDGIRGCYGDNLNAELSYMVGRALGQYFGEGEFVVGRDTRISGPDIEAELVRGLTDSGCNVSCVGVVPTPTVAWYAKASGALCGIVISASHNPPEYNGIKIFDGSGVKLSEEQEGSVEYYIDNQPPCAKTKGSVKMCDHVADLYVDHVVKTVNADFKGLKVWLDCGYGASGRVARAAYERLGASVNVDNDSLRGEKINCGCGALHPEYVRNSMKGTDTRLGFSFDGDADRLSVVCDGEVIDGDSVIYNISKSIELKDNIVVGTVLTNSALEKALAADGKKLLRTQVGDKFICDLMFRKGYNLGGEQSGHFIIYPESTTGDGLLSSMLFCKTLYNSKTGELRPIKKLSLTPQEAIAEYAEPSILTDEKFCALQRKYEAELKGVGRLIVRMSGTEPKVRVMCESEDIRLVKSVLAEFKACINSRN